MSEIILKAEHLKKYYEEKQGLFTRKKRINAALDDVSLEIRKGSIMAVSYTHLDVYKRQVVARARDTECITYAQIDLDYLDQIREQLPSLKNRRTDVYEVIGKEKNR